MKKLFSILVLSLAVLHLGAQADEAHIIYVQKGSQGDGKSWATAYGDLQQALLDASPNQQIWVAKGVYYPTQTSDRDRSFVIPSGVKLYGGFAGHETSLAQRQWRENLTILSGEIGTDDYNDNSFTVVYLENASPSTVIDGFAITGGAANGVNDLGDRQRCGAGIFNNGANGSSSPTIANCLFMNNYARDGAALYNFARNGNCSPKIVNCQFVGNKADLDGGAIFNDSRSGFTLLEIEHSLFNGNTANFGAGINNQADNGETRIVLKNSVFKGNTSYVRNIINDNEQIGGIYNLIKQACRFTDNVSVVGDDMNNARIGQKQPVQTYKRNSQIGYLKF